VEKYKAEMKYRTLYLSKAAHEFKSPLICINELIEEVDKQNNGNVRDLDLISKSINKVKNLSEYMMMLVKDFDFLSQNQTKKKYEIVKKEINLRRLVKFCYDIFKTRLDLKTAEDEAFVRLHYTIDTSLPMCFEGDEIRLKQILINLLSNSFKFTDEGEIRIEVRDFVEKDHHFMKFIVADTGKGIPEEKLSTIFQPFSKHELKNNTSGAGLGLGIVKELVEKAGKNLDVKSAVGKGTEISFLIPHHGSHQNPNHVVISFEDSYQEQFPQEPMIEHRNSNVVEGNGIQSLFSGKTEVKGSCYEFDYKNMGILDKPSEKSRSIGTTSRRSGGNVEFIDLLRTETNKKKYRIIVVEDESVVRKAVVRLLNSYTQGRVDIEVFECSDGAECLSLLYKGLTKRIEYDMIITDQSMRLVNGATLCQIMNNLITEQNLYELKIFMCSGYEANDSSLNALAKNKYFNGCFTKPLCKSHLDVMFEGVL